MVDSAKPNYVSLDLADAPADRPFVYTNMVMSADGKVVIEGTERGLGSPVDQQLMRELRTNADVVLNGANTLRKTGSSSRLKDSRLESLRISRGQPPNPIAAVLSSSGDIPLDRLFFTSDQFRAIVYLGDTASSERVAAILATGRELVEVPATDPVPAMFRHMRETLGAQRVLVEGGPTLNGMIFDQELIDEYFITIAPRLVGGDETMTPIRSDRVSTAALVQQLKLISAVTNPETGEMYLRYRRINS